MIAIKRNQRSRSTGIRTQVMQDHESSAGFCGDLYDFTADFGDQAIVVAVTSLVCMVERIDDDPRAAESPNRLDQCITEREDHAPAFIARERYSFVAAA